ncbi:TIGR04282 family arsenosugar biosynthesis glycosyltransferase [Blastococcus brunescens]|uniref:TIGR04282 family arsenosugar biosynthesis glycosyltransferase n=1 Tax=Blastococcus brunescens TaxID=1564165 RepID=A0ABZ1B4S9_9ACTN|nr:TIGR04282 family arsenosugar biosynthesis glycosyltransferase [Blastococcus sp. BMG 8361]WRL65818.1 TIGR04282 family arsenosugar biosynthesis glycosyltransferase [Blastococcus sp. BMG 8361]
MRQTQVLVITKAPVPGRSKTRLSPPCSPEQAAAIAAASVADTLDTVRAAPVARRVVALDGRPRDLDLDGFTVVPQPDGDLGARLAAAFADAMDGSSRPTLLIGMDTPQVTPELLDRCAGTLETAGPGTAVLGTAPDGGWWALGLHSAEPAAVLADVPMSRDDTAVRTREALEATGLTVHDLPELTDIDHFPDALAVAAECPPDSRTARVVGSVATALGLA